MSMELKRRFSKATHRRGLFWNGLRAGYLLVTGKVFMMMVHRRALRKRRDALRNKGAEQFKVVMGLCREAGAKPHLTFGTLLGCYRDRGLIKDDEDFDLGFFPDEIPDMDLLHKKVLEAGFEPHFEGKLQGKLAEIGKYHVRQYLHRDDGVSVDFNMFYRVRNSVVFFEDRSSDYLYREQLRQTGVFDGGQDVIGYAMVYPADIYQSFKKERFLGEEVLVPSGTQRFLELTYGEWKTPTKKFKYDNLRVVVYDASNDRYDFVTPVYPKEI